MGLSYSPRSSRRGAWVVSRMILYTLVTAYTGTGSSTDVARFSRLFFFLFVCSRKEVFQPHLPVRLPCYDLAPVTGFALTRPSRLHALGTGVYKARERIHRAMADARLLANPASWSRVADSNPYWDRFLGFAPRRRVAALCTGHCNTCVAPDVRAVLI